MKNQFTTKFNELMSDLPSGHASKPYSNTGMHWQNAYLTNSKNLPMGDGRPRHVLTYFGFRGYGDSHGDSNGDSCGYGMGMGIEMPSPRQPCRYPRKVKLLTHYA